jgi:hypothetical protein
MYELPLIAPAHGTNPCGTTEISNIAASIETHGMKYPQYPDFGKYWSLSTWTQFVHS